MSSKNYKIKFRFWIEDENSVYLGSGRINLLKAIYETGSIRKAAKKLNMSYKKAWKLVKSVNKSARKPLLTSKAGGTKGGHTTLTPYGMEIIEKYEKLQNNLNEVIHNEFNKIEF